MRFIGDFHIHSHYSIATSKNLIPEHLEYWARRKGITVVGTGDFTHPGWRAELEEKLTPTGSGLYRLKTECRPAGRGERIPENDVYFILTAEISSIYKKGDRVRKVHNLVFAPDFQTVDILQRKLSAIGNIASDGRPILGLDSRDLLEMVLDSSERCIVVPSHIWTPWFSVLGAQSGFDSIEECFGDLSVYIDAVETGLSSDPPMNRLCSFLDRYTLISNSDAHSPEKLGREANLLDTELEYNAITDSIRTGPPHFLGTVEFFPQEGKYHYDGHRKCGVSMSPSESRKRGFICPVCGKKMTIGVMSRVVQLSDREKPGEEIEKTPYYSLIPLKEILSEMMGVGPASKRVRTRYNQLLEKGVSELDFLMNLPLEEIKTQAGALLAEGIRRMRAGEVFIREGFDGEFGTISVFRSGESEHAAATISLFAGGSTPVREKTGASNRSKTVNSMEDYIGKPAFPDSAERLASDNQIAIENRKCAEEHTPVGDPGFVSNDAPSHNKDTGPVASGIDKPGASPIPLIKEYGLFDNSFDESTGVVSTGAVTPVLDPEQRSAVYHHKGPALVIAGPGTGKTRVLTERVAYLIEKGIDPKSILAVTFTNRACGEMKNRLTTLLYTKTVPAIHTFHSFGLEIIRQNLEYTGRCIPFSILDEDECREIILQSIDDERKSAERIANAVSEAKIHTLLPSQIEDEAVKKPFIKYEALLRRYNCFDFDDLIYHPVFILATHADIRDAYRRQYRWILVDEYQDVNHAQYRLIRLLMPGRGSNLFAIGDPDQAIYGFRGADAGFIERFTVDYPGATVYNLKKSYRCSHTILRASSSIVRKENEERFLQSLEEGVKLQIVEHPTDRSEAEWAARTIEDMIGGLRFFSMDSSISMGNETAGIKSLSDFAVLCRVREQMKEIEKGFKNHNIPFQTVSTIPFFREEPVRSVIDLLKLAVNPGQNLRAQRFVRQGILSSPDDRPRFDPDVSIRQNVARIIDRYMKIDSNNNTAFTRLYDLCDEFGTDLEAFFSYIDLGTGADLYRRDVEKVSLLTLHASKGLEFPCVIITGCEDGLCPFTLFDRYGVSLEEEKRLFYVGMTRAKRFLFLSHAKKRRLYGREFHLEKSLFIDRIEQSLVEIPEIEIPKPRKRDDNQLSLF